MSDRHGDDVLLRATKSGPTMVTVSVEAGHAKGVRTPVSFAVDRENSVPLDLVRALISSVIAVGQLYDVHGAWDAKENASRILAGKAQALLDLAPWLAEEERGE